MEPIIKSKESIKKHLSDQTRLELGCGRILSYLLTFREAVISDYRTRFTELIDIFSRRLSEDSLSANTRLIKNYASIFAPVTIALDKGMMLMGAHDTISVREVINLIEDTAYDTLKAQAFDEAELDECSMFLEYVMNMAAEVYIRNEYDYKVNKLNKTLELSVSIFGRFQRYYYDINKKQPPDTKALDRYLQSKPYFVGRDRTYFEFGDSGRKQLRCLVLKIDSLPDNIRDFFKSITE